MLKAARGCSMPRSKFQVVAQVHFDGRQLNPGDVIELEAGEDGRPVSRLLASRVRPFKGTLAVGDAETVLAEAKAQAKGIVAEAEAQAAAILEAAKAAKK